MKKVALLIGTFLIGINAHAQNYEAGEKVFKMNCSSCHKMDSKLIGPPLMNVVADQGEEWTKKWILNNEELRKSGDVHAIAIFEEYKKMVMPNYTFLTKDELTDVLTFLKDWGGNQVTKVSDAPAVAGQSAFAEPKPAQTKMSSSSIIVLFLLGLAVVLTVVTMVTLLSAFKTLLSFKIIATKKPNTVK